MKRNSPLSKLCPDTREIADRVRTDTAGDFLRTPHLSGAEVYNLKPQTTYFPNHCVTVVVEEKWTVEPDGSILIVGEAWEEPTNSEDETILIDDSHKMLAYNHETDNWLLRHIPRKLLIQAFTLERDDDVKADIAAELARRGGADDE